MRTLSNFLQPFEARHIEQLTLSDNSQLISRVPNLLEAYEVLKRSYSFKYQDKIFACGGIVKFYEEVGEVWFVLDQGHGLPTFKVCSLVKEYINYQIKHEYRRLQATVKCNDQKAIRFVEWLGFECEGRLTQSGLDREDYYIYARGRWQE